MDTMERAGSGEMDRLMTLMTGDEKHDGSATSTLDAIWTLYDSVLRVDPAFPEDPGRDRFLLSKGHGPMAYYAVLAARGFLSEDQLAGLGGFDSALGHHPDATLIPGAEIGSGSLGHGLPLAVGTALGLRSSGHKTCRVVVMTGDAELEEGSNWEAVQFAGRADLEQLMAVVIDNDSASSGWPGGIGARFALEGWSSVDVDGHDRPALARTYAGGQPGRPYAVIAHVQAETS